MPTPAERYKTACDAAQADKPAPFLNDDGGMVAEITPDGGVQVYAHKLTVAKARELRQWIRSNVGASDS